MHSSREALARARLEIRIVKGMQHRFWMRLPDGTIDNPPRTWAELPEERRLEALEDRVNWRGVSKKDQYTLIACEVEVGKLCPFDRQRVLEYMGGADVVVMSLIDSRPPPEPPSPAPAKPNGRQIDLDMG